MFIFNPGVNFINVFHAAFTCADPKTVKWYLWLDWVLTLSGSVHVKAACRTLMKFTPGLCVPPALTAIFWGRFEAANVNTFWGHFGHPEVTSWGRWRTPTISPVSSKVIRNKILTMWPPITTRITTTTRASSKSNTAIQKTELSYFKVELLIYFLICNLFLLSNEILWWIII